MSLTVVDRCSHVERRTPSRRHRRRHHPGGPHAAARRSRADPAADIAADIDEYAAPALSFDGSTIVWSTGSEIRRYVRPALVAGGVAADHLLVDSFDVELAPSAVVMTGADVDVSDDGTAVVFVAGPGTTPFAPDPGNVYVWSRTAAPADADASNCCRRTTAGEPGAASSGSPTMSADGSLVLFDSTSADLAAIGTDPVTDLVTARSSSSSIASAEGHVYWSTTPSRPAVSGDGRHVAYERGGAIRLLSSTDGTIVRIDHRSGNRRPR